MINWIWHIILTFLLELSCILEIGVCHDVMGGREEEMANELCGQNIWSD